MKNNNKHNKGFTLIEALVVVIIVGLLAAVGVIKLGSAKTDTLEGLAQSAAAEINKGMQRAVVANNGSGWSVACAAPTDTTDGAYAATVIDALQTAGHFTLASATQMKDALTKAAALPSPIKVAPVAVVAGADLKTLGQAGLEFKRKP